MNFREFLEETSYNKIKSLYIFDDYDLVDKFKELFNYNENIVIFKVPFGGKAYRDGKIEYSSKGTLIHELFHLLQYKTEKTNNKYNNLKMDKICFLKYILQKKELNNQAISVAFSLKELNKNISDIKIFDNEDIYNLDLSNIENRLSLFFSYLKQSKSSRKKVLIDKIEKYKRYMQYIDYELNNIEHSPITFI